ncbi:MAG: hypothetical protein ACREME_05185 [Gemmatimonadales bacterium]
MNRTVAILSSVLVLGAGPAPRTHPAMTFFLTSEGPGKGADLGGLDGADRHCHDLAAAAGASDTVQWRAYLGVIAREGAPAVHARDRIGTGPWFNAKGVKIADNVADLHSENNNLSKETALTEAGAVVNGRGDDPNMHDILTGSQMDGSAYTAEDYTNCDNWTSSGPDGGARVGHHDRSGGGQNPTSWNSAHTSRGCGQENLRGTGGNGLFYCFGVAR